MQMKAIGLGIAALAVCSVARADSVPTAPDLLQSMRTAERSARYSGVLVLRRAGQSPMTMRVYRDGLRRRVEWISPPIMRGDVLVDNGQRVWRYEKSGNAAFETRSTPADSDMPGNAPARSPNARLMGAGTTGGRPVWIVSVARSNGSERRFWIDKATKLRLRAEVFGPQNHNLESMELQSLHLGAQPASLFDYSPPAGADVTHTNGTAYSRLNAARRAASWLRSPSHLPTGYAFESAIVDPAGKAWLRYTNGTERFSIFQERSPGEDAPPQAVAGGWFVRTGGSRFAIVGAPDGEGQRIAASLQ